MSTSISLTNLRKEYGEHVAIADLSLQIRDGEFFTLLGPSGCGKTTLLRMIAGFNSIEGGTIEFNGEAVNDLAPGQRNIGMVFQNYALFPQMSAGKNVGFGLENRKVTKLESQSRIGDALAEVHMSGFADRLPGNMSGGQQQRVALARAMVISPAVLLMDEPLSNLDAKLRVEMRETIRRVQLESNITTVYVTHDQEEAMAVSDRIAVMHDGDVQHVGSPEEIYHRPANLFVAEFIGKANRFTRVLRSSGGRAILELNEDVRIDLTDGLALDVARRIAASGAGEPVIVSARPEAVAIAETGFAGRVVAKTFLGSHTQYQVEVEPGVTLEVSEAAGLGSSRDIGSRVHLSVDPGRLNLFDSQTHTSLMRGVEHGSHPA